MPPGSSAQPRCIKCFHQFSDPELTSFYSLQLCLRLGGDLNPLQFIWHNTGTPSTPASDLSQPFSFQVCCRIPLILVLFDTSTNPNPLFYFLLDHTTNSHN